MESYLQNQYTLALVLNRIKHVATLTIVVVQISTYYPWLEAPRVLRANLAFLTLLDVSVPHVSAFARTIPAAPCTVDLS